MIAKILSDNLTYAQVNSENPNICFLHGWGGESNNWKNISKEFESIAIDIPGFGKSVPFEQSGPPEFYAEYLIELIPDSVEVIVGHSFGGTVAVHLSQLKNYKKIVVIGSPLIRSPIQLNPFSLFKLFKFLIENLKLFGFVVLPKSLSSTKLIFSSLFFLSFLLLCSLMCIKCNVHLAALIIY